MKGPLKLAEGAFVLAQLVDGLEVSCTVDQSRRYGDQPSDELEACLALLQRQAREASEEVGTQWSVSVRGDQETVVMLPYVPRQRGGWRYALESSAWLLLVSSDGASKPRFCVQLRADRLLTDGALNAYLDAKVFVEKNLLPLVGRRVDVEPAWRISRIDLAADVAGDVLQTGDAQLITTRARAREWIEEPVRSCQHARELTTLRIGARSGAAFARLYDKTRQAAPRAPIREYWQLGGYERATHGGKVWRVEFEVRASLLRQL